MKFIILFIIYVMFMLFQRYYMLQTPICFCFVLFFRQWIRIECAKFQKKCKKKKKSLKSPPNGIAKDFSKVS